MSHKQVDVSEAVEEPKVSPHDRVTPICRSLTQLYAGLARSSSAEVPPPNRPPSPWDGPLDC